MPPKHCVSTVDSGATGPTVSSRWTSVVQQKSQQPQRPNSGERFGVLSLDRQHSQQTDRFDAVHGKKQQHKDPVQTPQVVVATDNPVDVHWKNGKFSKKVPPKISYNGQGAKQLIRNLITDFLSNDIEGGKLFLLDAIKLCKNQQERGKILEVMAAYQLWEFSDKRVIDAFLANSRAGDGYSPLNWVFWPYTKTAPLSGFSRTLQDYLQMIDVLYSMGYIPIDRNQKGESVIESLRQAVKEGYVPTNWFNALHEKCAKPSKNIITAVLVRLGNLITPENCRNYSTEFCWAFLRFPFVVIQQIITRCTECDAMQKSGHWEIVKRIVSMYRDMIKVGPNIKSREYADYEIVLKDWNTPEQLKKFSQDLGICASEKDPTDSKEFPGTSGDRLAAIVGESGYPKIQNEYMTKCLTQNSPHLAIYCLAHGKVFDSTVLGLFLEKLDTFGINEKTKEKFMLMEIFGTYSKKTIANIDELKVIIREIIAERISRKTKKQGSAEPVAQKVIDTIPTTQLPKSPPVAQEVSDPIFDISLFDKLTWIKGCIDRDGYDDFSYSIETDFRSTSLESREVLLENIVLKVIEVSRKSHHVKCFERVFDTLTQKKFISASSMKKLIARLTPLADDIVEFFDLPNKITLGTVLSTFA